MKCEKCQRERVEAAFIEYHAKTRERQIALGSLIFIATAFVFGFVLGALIF